MSVINQMLKDLDKRAPDTSNQAVSHNQISPVNSTKKIIVITGLTVLIICMLGFYIWHIVSENNALKADKSAKQRVTQENKAVIRPVINDTVNSTVALKQNGVESPKKPHSTINTKVDTVRTTTEVANLEAASSSQVTPTPAAEQPATKVQSINRKPLKVNADTRITAAKKPEALTNDHSHAEGYIGHTHTKSTATTKKSNVSKMSVSRRQLSADELAKQKLDLAEKALAAKQISKAEKLLEEVVIIKPDDSQTRKKLAALWYGRKAYQNATNLLSQGIALDEKDSSLRELKARIHLQQGQINAALNTLTPLSYYENEQYQVMLANVAQQAQQNEIAANAYKLLIDMQPEKGRWYLGMAVLYDKNSQFNLASSAYKKALTKKDLSVSSESFIRQRIEVIGQ